MNVVVVLLQCSLNLVYLHLTIFCTIQNLGLPLDSYSSNNRLGCKSCTAVTLEYLSCPSEISIALLLIPRAIKAWWNDFEIFEIVQPLSHYITGSEGGVKDLFDENVINLVIIDSKGRKSPLAANSALLHLSLRMPMSPLLIATSPCTQFDASSTGNQNGGRETWNT